MTETASVVAALVVVVGAVGGVPLAAFAGGTAGGPADGQVAANGTEGMAPGERLSGVVGAERASVEGEMASRTFGQQVAAASSNDSRAAVVGDEIATLQDRLDELRAERTELETAHENGTMSEGEYRARAARLHAQQRALQRRASDTRQVAGGLPADQLRANGVNVTALQTVRTEAKNLTGPEVAAVAREISGRNPTGGLGPDRAGPPGDVGNRTGGGPPSEADDGGGRAGGAGDGGGPPGTDNETGPSGDAGNESKQSDGTGDRPGQPDGTETPDDSDERP